MPDQEKKIRRQLEQWASKMEKAEEAGDYEAINRATEKIAQLESQLDSFWG